MYTKLKPSTKSSLGIFLLLSIFFLTSMASGAQSGDYSDDCTYYGTVIDLSVDSCGYQIIMDNGTSLQLADNSVPDFFHDSLRIVFGFEVIDSVSNQCGIGFLVHLTCCQPVEEPECQASFVYERIPVFPVDSVSSDTIPPMAYVYQFYDRSTGDVIEWHWQFEDEVIDGVENPVYEFPAPGNYEVCLTIVTSDSCYSSYCETIHVTDSIPGDCKAMFWYYCPVDTPVYDFPGSTLLHFIDLSEGNVTQWYWDFDDSTTSEEQHPFHEFPASGIYNVCLTVSCSDGCEDTYCTHVTVGIPDSCAAYFEYCNYSSMADDVYYSDDVFAVGFKNLSTPESYESRWEFGDGSYSSEKNPVHIYYEPGLYDVCLHIYSENGCSDTYCTTVNVGNAYCSVDFTWELLVPDCLGYDIAHMFTPILEREAWSYSWDFGDGYYSYDPIAAHIYTNEGYYDVCLEVFYENNCAARTCKTILVSWENRDSIFRAECNPSGFIPPQSDKALSILNAYPNPASDNLVIDLFSDTERQITIQFIDMLGKAVKRRTSYLATAGNNQLEIPLNEFETGSYICLISSSELVLRGRVSVIK